MGNVIPTVFATSKKQFNERFTKLRPLSRHLQIDFMDGKFVKGKSVSLDSVPDLNGYINKFEAHLMVSNPGAWVNKLKKKGFSKVIFHYEAVDDIKVVEIVSRIKRAKMEAFLAVNPGTAVGFIYPYLEIVNGVLFMGVHPGKEHQSLISKVYSKIRELRDLDKNVVIQVDGGVNKKTAPLLKASGVTLINSGSFVSDADDPKKALRQLKSYFK